MAANSILKLKVETEEYDAKLKRAAEGIRHLADVAHKSGGELTGLEKSELDYIRALGEMETKTRSAAGQVRELESSYKELKVIYDQLNEVEKADEGGKALAASLEQIKQRAQDAKTQLEQASQSLQENANAGKESGGILDSLAQKFTINIDALKLFDFGLQAAGAALDVAKDAFFSSETNVDDWGRTVQSAESVYQSFLVSLNTGDFSGFLSRIGQVTQAAKDAYNALDELGTRMTIINPERARLQARQQELRADIRRNGSESEVGKQALAELKKIEPLLSKSFQTESQMNYNAFESLVKQRLAEGGINLDQKSFRQFMTTFSNDAAFQRLRRNARGSIGAEYTAGGRNDEGTARRVDTRNTEQKLLDLFTDEWRKANSGYLSAAFNAQGAAASNALGNARYMKAGTGSGSGKSDTTKEQTEQQKNQEQINKLQQQYVDIMAEASKAGIPLTDEQKQLTAEIQDQIYQLQKRNALLGVYAEQAQGRLLPRAVNFQRDGLKNVGGIGMLDQATNFGRNIEIPSGGLQLSDKLMSIVGKQIEEQNDSVIKAVKERTKGDDSITKLSKGISGLNSIMGGFEKMGIEIPSEMKNVVGVIEGVMSVIQGVQTIISLTQTPAIIYNTAAIMSLEAAIWANTATSWFPFAKGGIVPHAAGGYFVGGSHYSGDVTPIMANAGELVLNRSQQFNLASQLEGGGMQGLNLTATIRGEQIRLALNNNGRRTGRGEYVQSTKR